MIKMPIIRVGLYLAAAAALGLPCVGCGKKPDAAEASPQIRQLKGVYRLTEFAKKTQNAPIIDVEGFRSMKHSCPFGYESLESGECVLNWEGYLKSSAYNPSVILAYEKDAPTQGGNVVMMDGTVKALSVEEFRANIPKSK